MLVCFQQKSIPFVGLSNALFQDSDLGNVAGSSKVEAPVSSFALPHSEIRAHDNNTKKRKLDVSVSNLKQSPSLVSTSSDTTSENPIPFIDLNNALFSDVKNLTASSSVDDPLVSNSQIGDQQQLQHRGAMPLFVPSSSVATPAPLVPNNTFYSRQQQPMPSLLSPTPLFVPSSVIQPASMVKKTSVKNLTEQQKIRRRLNNNKHAKKSRLRKKYLLQNLKEQIKTLEAEVECVQGIIRKECPDKAEKLFESVSSKIRKPNTSSILSYFEPGKPPVEPKLLKMSILSKLNLNFTIADANRPGSPFVFVSQGFLDLTGYTREYVLGRSGRFLQGSGTDQNSIEAIRKGMKDGVDTSVCILNYKSDGTPFWNQLYVGVIRDENSNIVNYIGVHTEVTKVVVEENNSSE